MKRYTLLVLVIGTIFASGIFLASTKNIATLPLSQSIQSAYENKVYFWANEPMPSTNDAMERLDRELSVNAYWQSNTLLNIKKSNRYFPIIEPILREEGVPDDFKYLAVAESDLRNVTSSANARGFWQFRKLAAKEMGLEVNDEVDERYHVEKSTRAACKYLKKLKERFGTWTNAAAAYNVGPTNFSKLQSRQGEFSYYDMNVNIETGRYVFRLIAIKEVMTHPEDFGFQILHHEKYAPLDNFYNIKVESSVINWKDFAAEHNVSYRELKRYNPWLIDTKLTVKKNTYFIKIPTK